MRATAAFLLVLCHLALSHALDCNEISLLHVNQIDAGLGQVVAIDKSRNAYFLSGTSWTQLPLTNWKHISVGPAGIWGINTRDYIYKYGYGSWINAAGRLKQMDAGGFTFVVGANSGDYPYCLRSSSVIPLKAPGSVPWRRMSGRVKYYSCGPYGCWAVNRNNDVFLMKTVTPTTCAASSWQHISGKLTMIEVATDGTVVGVSTSGHVYSRSGITAARPQGTSWTKIPMCVPMRHVSYDLGRFWVVTRNGMGLVCTH